jgi:hypothetical protein
MPPLCSAAVPSHLRIALKDVIPGVAAAVAVVALYAWAFRGPIHLIPSDPFGYAWQFRAVREGLLGSVDPRPGTVVLGSMATAFSPIPGSVAPVLLSLAMIAVLGLVVAVVSRRALDLPCWALFPLAIAAATFGATGKLAAYIANLVALVCFAAGVSIIVTSRSVSWPAVLAAAAAFLAAGLAHPAVLPMWFAILGSWLVLSLISRLLDMRRAGPTSRPFDRRALAAFVALVLGALGTSAIVLGVLGRAANELGNLSTAAPYFDERLVATWEWIEPTVLFSVVGTIAMVLYGWRRGDRGSQALLVSWALVSLGGTALILVAPGFPGHRALMLATPLGVAAGMVAVAVALLAVRGGDRGLNGALSVAAILMTAVIAALGLTGFGRDASAPWRERAIPARRVAAYALASPRAVPIVMAVEPRNAGSARHWKGRLNIARSFLDGHRASQLFVYVGDPMRLLAGEPSSFPESDDPLEQALDRISARTWPDVRRALDDGAVIVLPKGYVRYRSWKRAIARGATASGSDLLVVGGGSTPAPRVPPHAAISRSPGWAAAIVWVVLLGAIGGGLGLLLAGDAGKLGDLVAAAPAYGVVLCVLVGTVTAIMGGDPGGSVALVVLVGVALACWLIGLVRTTVPSRTRVTPSTA